TVRVFRPGATFTDGISPSLTTGGKEFFAGRTVLFTATPSHAASFVEAPKQPTITTNAGAGTFAAARDVYLADTYVNRRGMTRLSKPAVVSGTSANDQFSVPSPTLSAFDSALAGANAITGYNVYEADVAAGGPAPAAAAFKKVNTALVAIGTATLV